MSTIERAAARLGNLQKAQKQVPIVDPQPIDDGLEQPLQDELRDDQTTDHVETVVDDVKPVLADRVRTPIVDSLEPVLPAFDNPIGGGYAEIDLEDLAARGFATRQNIGSHLALDFRRIKRPLLLSARKGRDSATANPPNLLLVTSSVPDEGKTFVAINLALSIAAEKDHNVLLVDGDTIKGDVAKVLGIEYESGLTDVLQKGGAYIEDAVLQTNVENLCILPSGPAIPDSDELFASDLMVQVARDLADRQRDRIVIFDGPPLLAGTEASVLAALMGQVVVVVEADRTQQTTVTEALTQLEGCQSVSLVLNKVARRARDHTRYGYGYGYDYASSQGS